MTITRFSKDSERRISNLSKRRAIQRMAEGKNPDMPKPKDKSTHWIDVSRELEPDYKGRDRKSPELFREELKSAGANDIEGEMARQFPDSHESTDRPPRDPPKMEGPDYMPSKLKHSVDLDIGEVELTPNKKSVELTIGDVELKKNQGRRFSKVRSVYKD